MSHSGTWFSGRLGRVEMVGLDELKGLLQPKQFYDSLDLLKYRSIKSVITNPSLKHNTHACWEKITSNSIYIFTLTE